MAAAEGGGGKAATMTGKQPVPEGKKVREEQASKRAHVRAREKDRDRENGRRNRVEYAAQVVESQTRAFVTK